MDPGIMELHEFKRGWTGGLPETPCGFGSRIDQTVIQRKALAAWAHKYDLHVIHDIGAGDLNWIHLVEWPQPFVYRAYDLVPRKPEVAQLDLTSEIPPPADLTLCLWLLNHLPVPKAQAALGNLLASGSKYIAYTWWPAMDDSLDICPVEHVVIRPRIQAELRLVRC